MSLMDDGFFYKRGDVLYKSFKVETNINKCVFCEFNMNNQCHADKELYKVCKTLKNYYWKTYTIPVDYENTCYLNLNIEGSNNYESI